MTEKSGSGSRVLLIVSVIILAVTVLFTAAYALFLMPRQSAAQSAGSPEQTGPAAQTAPVAPTAADGPAVAPDWLEAERMLDELAQQTPEVPETPEAPEAEEAPAENPFTDVSETDPCYDAALWAREQGVLTGSEVSPDKTCTRAQAMTFLWRQAGSPESALTESPFNDVAGSDYFYQPVLWAFENGLVSMPRDGRFQPSGALTRGQMVVFFCRRSGGTADGLENPFSDVAEDSYYHDAALWAASRGIVRPDDTGAFGANTECTRAEFITGLYRCFAQ